MKKNLNRIGKMSLKLFIFKSIHLQTRISSVSQRCLSLSVAREAKYSKRLYRDPLLEKSELAAPLPEDDDRRFLRIRAAKTHFCPLIFDDPVFEKFMLTIMNDGRKDEIRERLHMAFAKIKRVQYAKRREAKTEEEKEAIEMNPVKILHGALENCEPTLQLREVRRAGITYHVPLAISEKQSKYRAMRYYRQMMDDRKGSTYVHNQLADVLLDSYYGKGIIVQKKQELHRQCEANRAFAHFMRKTR